MDKPISFEQEPNHTKHYLALEKIRFGDYLTICYDIQATLFRLPTLTLRLIVENAVRYGVTKREEGGNVTIATAETGDAFVITVADDGVGYDPFVMKADGRSHIGINNVNQRLKSVCGGRFEISSRLNEGTTAVITIPKREE